MPASETSMASALETPRSGARGESSFWGTSALLFIAAAGVTIFWTGSMESGMAMPGGWTMSMAWMRMPRQTWLGAAASFMGMWLVMMVAMMLPSLTGMLMSYRRSLHRLGGAQLRQATALAATGYFLVWMLVGAAVYPLGIALAAIEMRWEGLSRLVPLATGGALLFAGCIQLSGWKARQLALCRSSPECLPASIGDRRSGLAHGLHLGVHCGLCCSGYVMLLLVTGVMDLAVMAAVAAGITLERLAPCPERIARTAGLIVVAAGAIAIAAALRPV